MVEEDATSVANPVTSPETARMMEDVRAVLVEVAETACTVTLVPLKANIQEIARVLSVVAQNSSKAAVLVAEVVSPTAASAPALILAFTTASMRKDRIQEIRSGMIAVLVMVAVRIAVAEDVATGEETVVSPAVPRITRPGIAISQVRDTLPHTSLHTCPIVWFLLLASWSTRPGGQALTESAPSKKPPSKHIPQEASVDDLWQQHIPAGINFERHSNVEVTVTGTDCDKSPMMYVLALGHISVLIASAFRAFGDATLTPQLLENVKKAGYTTPTPIQQYAIPYILAERDIMACAITGSGKTVRFIEHSVPN